MLILDEIDKLGGQPTPFKIETVLLLVDKVYQENGVVIATSNHDEDWFVKTWGEEIVADRSSGGSPARRRHIRSTSWIRRRGEDRLRDNGC